MPPEALRRHRPVRSGLNEPAPLTQHRFLPCIQAIAALQAGQRLAVKCHLLKYIPVASGATLPPHRHKTPSLSARRDSRHPGLFLKRDNALILDWLLDTSNLLFSSERFWYTGRGDEHIPGVVEALSC